MGRTTSFSAICLLICVAFSAMQVDSLRGERFGSHDGQKQVREVGSWSSAKGTLEETIDASLVVPEGNHLQQVLFAVGVQIYTNNGSAWVLTNVSADLYDFKGVKVGFHFFLAEQDSNGGQATWETFYPSSRVTGKSLASVAQTDSIPWLLLQATSNSGSKKFFGSTTIVQRLYTQDGLSPSADYPARAGDVFNSAYTSLYTFSKAQKHSKF